MVDPGLADGEIRAYIGAMPKRSSKRPRDLNQLASALVDEATGEHTLTSPDRAPVVVLDAGHGARVKNQAAVELGRLGGRKGGAARAARLSKQQRSEIARKAALARWQTKR